MSLCTSRPACCKEEYSGRYEFQLYVFSHAAGLDQIMQLGKGADAVRSWPHSFTRNGAGLLRMQRYGR
jgi:hypothetical protein